MMEDKREHNPNIIDELRRRKVLRSTTIYAVVGWCLLQWSELMFRQLGWPDWSITLVLTAVVLGFPVTVALSWAFDITADGVRRTDPYQLPEPRRSLASRVVDLVTALAFMFTLFMLVREGGLP